MFRLAAAQWLLLLPVLAVLAWRWPRAELWRPWRAICLVLLTLFLARPEVRQTASGLDLWVLMDRSASAAEVVDPRRAEIERLLESTKGAQDQIHYVDFAAAPVLRESATAFESSLGETRLRLAAEFALANINPKKSSRLLAVTDGYSTEDLQGLSGKLLEAKAPLDLRLMSGADGEDYRIERLRAPERVRPGEAFLIEARVSGTKDGEVPYELKADGVKIGEGAILLQKGRGILRVAGRALQPGARRYEVRLLPSNDTRPGNNAAHCWIEVSAGPSILLLTAYEDDPLAAVLSAQGFAVETVRDLQTLHPGYLSGPRLVIFNNVPAHLIPADFLNAMDFFVNAQGGGLLMAGGRFSFGAGGYFQSALDPLLPVSMELREEHRKLAVAMAIVLDRSGSMAAGVSGGGTKMDLADEGAARAIELLGASDAVTVFAVDSEPHTIVPLTRIGRDARKISSEVRKIQSAGGGIFVYVGLKAAWEELKKSTAGQRHVVLFADAADAEEPGEYVKLLEEMSAAGVTVSVIGLGTPQDSDADFLVDVAKRGNGRIFFNADAMQLPGLFAQETVAVARSAFLTDPVAVVDAGGWLEIASKPLPWLPSVDGYNLSYLKPEAASAAVTGDEYKAPLVAFWQRGAGRAAAVSFPLGGSHSAAFRAWAQGGDFEQTLARWLLPQVPPAGISLRSQVEGTDVLIDLLHDERWTSRLAENPPRLTLVSGAEGKPFTVPWERIQPGRYSVRVAIPPGEWLRGVVQADGERWPFGPIAAGVDPEWDFAPEKIQAVKDLCKVGGGREITDLGDVWKAPRREDFLGMGNWLLGALLVCFLIEVAVTRWRGVAA